MFYYGYLEIVANNVQVDLKKPIGHEQLLRTYDSGGAGGGPCTCTDGESIWGFSTDGGRNYIYRADGKPFGDGAGEPPQCDLGRGLGQVAGGLSRPGGRQIIRLRG